MTEEENKVKITVSRADFDKIKARLESSRDKYERLVGIKVNITATAHELNSIEGTLLLRLESK